eukprot:7461699-Pyramimonas_sp.AAC.1
MVQPLRESHQVRSVTVSPEAFGWPLSRERSFTYAINVTTMAWVGPTDYKDDFLHLFGQFVLSLTAEDFYVDSEASVIKDLQARGKRRGHCIPDD